MQGAQQTLRTAVQTNAISNEDEEVFLQKCATPLTAIALLLALDACKGGGAIPSSSVNASDPMQTFGAASEAAPLTDETSVLKELTKNVVIGSTVDPKNGDKGPHSISIVKANLAPLKKGQLMVCNFEDSSGTPGNGTTIELLNAAIGSSPTQFAQGKDLKGCAGVAVSSQSDYVYGAGLSSGLLTPFTPKGVEQKTFGPPLQAPFSDTDVANKGLYAAEYIFTGDAKTGSVVSAGANTYASGFYMQVATGFDVNNKSGLNALGPSGLSYYPKGNLLFVADGVDDAVVEFTNPNDLLVKNEIVVEKHGTAFKCLHAHTTCGKLVFKGKPLDAPVAMVLLPNGNLILANTVGGNMLVEIAANGKVLDTKVVDKSKTAGIFGLAATGTDDSDTVLFYTDANTNTVHELER